MAGGARAPSAFRFPAGAGRAIDSYCVRPGFLTSLASRQSAPAFAEAPKSFANEPNVLSILLTPEYAPFAIAFVIMVGIGLIEAIGLGVGHLGAHADFDTDVDGPSFLDWLGLGAQIPILIWLTSLLACFSLAGVAIQQIAAQLLGAPLHWGLAAGAALVLGGILNGFVATGFARIMPTFEATVVSQNELVRRRGTVLEGTARRGAPTRAKVIDQHRQVHYIMVEPHHDDDVLAPGETGLLVRREGTIFYLLPDAHPQLRPMPEA
jgi:hypothetical protein